MKKIEDRYITRKYNRLKGYDYSKYGYYYVTICTYNRVNWFGEIKNGGMVLNETGSIIQNCWEHIAIKYNNVDLDTYCVMPNHLHGIIICRGLIHQTRKKDQTIKNDQIRQDNHIHYIQNNNEIMNITGVMNHAPTDWMLMKNDKLTLGKIIRHFKARSTKIIRDNDICNFKWQRSFYDHIIRTDQSLNKIRAYITNNPRTWDDDKENITQTKNVWAPHM